MAHKMTQKQSRMANLAVYQNPGLATATSTRVDSAAKHILACKVDSDLMLHLVGSSVPSEHRRRELHVQKHKYCMFKNDLVMNVSQPLFATDNSVTSLHTRAYPAVVSTLANIDAASRAGLVALYSAYRGSDFETMILAMTDPKTVPGIDTDSNVLKMLGLLQDSKMFKQLPYFSAQGYALGTAWASDQTGDTVASVLIGGMQTVMNGAFACQPGEVLQWYFEFEENMFYPKTVTHGKKDNFRRCAAGSRKTKPVEMKMLENLEENAQDIKKIIEMIKKKYQMMFGPLPSSDSDSPDVPTEFGVISQMLSKTGSYLDRPVKKVLKVRTGGEGGSAAAGENTEPEFVYAQTVPINFMGYTFDVYFTDKDTDQIATLYDVMRYGGMDNYAAARRGGGLSDDNDFNSAMDTFAGDPNKKRRREFHEREDGMPPEQKTNKFYPKPYRLYDGDDVYGDKIRIFAKCVSGGRPHEMIDIMLMTQSL